MQRQPAARQCPAAPRPRRVALGRSMYAVLMTPSPCERHRRISTCAGMPALRRRATSTMRRCSSRFTTCAMRGYARDAAVGVPGRLSAPGRDTSCASPGRRRTTHRCSRADHRVLSHNVARETAHISIRLAQKTGQNYNILRKSDRPLMRKDSMDEQLYRAIIDTLSHTLLVLVTARFHFN